VYISWLVLFIDNIIIAFEMEVFVEVLVKSDKLMETNLFWYEDKWLHVSQESFFPKAN